jgi:hypothetical protein
MRLFRWTVTGLAVAVLALPGGRADRGDRPAGDAGKRPAPLVGKVKAEVQPDIDRYLADAQARTLKELEKGKDFPALFKVPARVKAITDPWGGMADVEQTGLDLAGASSGGLAKLPALLDGMAGLLGKPAAEEAKVQHGKLVTLEDHAKYWTAVLDKAKEQQDAAFAKLKPEDRKFLFEWPHSLLPNFGPMAFLDEKTERQLKNDRAFCTLATEQVDWAKFLGSARTLAALADADYLAELTKVLEKARPLEETVPGVTGELLYKKETPHGLILVGGKGPNTYHLTVPVALLIDSGGDDTYRGTVAAGFDADHPNGVVIDLAGDDTYEGEELRLATGRMGVGLLVDVAGKDTYHLPLGTGGAGFAGIGILCDLAGDDVYEGSQYTQGAALAGLGLLWDAAGDDRYSSDAYALGFGGPAGVGVVLDASGSDRYRCGKKLPSGYNQSDAPNAFPGQPEYQYDCFGMGMGLGRRVISMNKIDGEYSLAGGVGMVIDVQGDDRYDSSNFSQGCGYYFGIGVKLDLAGDDVHGAARYGMASGAHFGMGLFIDYAGKDTYVSVGPTYNCGCAWDHTVCLFIEGGGDDVYQLERSAGCGRADIGSWAVFADLAGSDRYRVNSGLADVSKDSLAFFFDGEGDDEYQVKPTGEFKPGNGKSNTESAGGRFVDR